MKVFRWEENQLHIDRERCIACGRCSNNCCTEALRLVGEHKSDSEIKKILMRDENFYQETGGGVTFSGGEVTSQPQYASRLMELMKEEGISVALDTCGYCDADIRYGRKIKREGDSYEEVGHCYPVSRSIYIL